MEGWGFMMRDYAGRIGCEGMMSVYAVMVICEGRMGG